MSADTIAAVATAPGRGGVAIVRVSGPDAFAVARAMAGREPEPGRVRFARFFQPSEQQAHDNKVVAPPSACCRGLVVSPADTSAKTCCRGLVVSPADSSAKTCCRGLVVPIDSGLLLAFRAPHSYTGEDVVEFQCHGGTVTPRRILEACFAAGARPARRGEFTERAFLNGRMDLSEAESVIELVDARTDRAAADALSRQFGSRKASYRALYDRALALSAELEHALDVDEGELPVDFVSERSSRAAALAAEARRLAGSAAAGRLLREGALVVLAGPPNAGKSSLLNALCGFDRAIVSPEPGTTRDTVEAWIDLDGWPVRLVDTAGLRETGNAIEAEGVRRAGELLSKADVVVALDADIPGALVIHAKCDLDDAGAAPRQTGLRVSAKTGEGLQALRSAIAERLAALAGEASEDGATASEREYSILLSAARQLESPPADPVLLANAVRSAAEALGALVGATYSDDMLDALFSRFCVGK